MKKLNKKKWNKPSIKSELEIKQTLGMGNSGGDAQAQMS
jgi:hypothetical protein